MKKESNPQIIRHDHPVRNAVAATVSLICVAIAAFISANTHYGWIPGWNWRNIYQKTGLGIEPYSERSCQVRMLDAGAGDCIWVSCGETDILIDTGRPEDASATTAELLRCGLKKLDYLILTHYHTDHTGGLEAVLDAFQPETILLGQREGEGQTDAVRQIQWMCHRSGGVVLYAQAGDTFRSDGLETKILSDGAGFSDENNGSLIIRMQYGQTAMLFMGDAEEKAEERLLASGIDLSADWIKLAHHGSKTSTTEALLKAAAPTYAAITCGTRETPDEEVLLRLRTRQICYARTDLNGAILFSTDGIQCGMDVQYGKKIE